jgi:nitroimidazol reductase NimA-like FMN-containing flavoprotein (pyridoxamine 5'-phosphate oxidase superfamily)
MKEHVMEPVLEQLSEDECLRLISPGGVGRLAFSGRYGLSVFPVNYKVQEGSVVFRTAAFSPTDEDLRTGIPRAEYKVAFEVDAVDESAREGWSVLIQGPAHHMDSVTEQDAAGAAGVEPWAGGNREHAIRITPTRVAGRRIRRAG